MARAEEFQQVEYLLIHGTADGELLLIGHPYISHKTAVLLLTKQTQKGKRQSHPEGKLFSLQHVCCLALFMDWMTGYIY